MNALATKLTQQLLAVVAGGSMCPSAQVVYAAKVGPRILYQKHNTVPGPDVSDKTKVRASDTCQRLTVQLHVANEVQRGTCRVEAHTCKLQ